MYLEIVNGNVYLKKGLHDFNYTKVINKKNRLPYKKFYVYKNKEILKLPNSLKQVKILEVIDNPRIDGNKIAVYIDPHERVSFMIVKPHKILSLENVLEKAESTPPHRVFVFSFMKSIYILGVIRFRYSNMKKINISIGYEKTLNYDFSYLFPEKIRQIFSEFTSKIFLPIHLGFSKIPYQDLLLKYNKSSEINNPLYIKSITEDNLNYYYQLKMDGYDKYNRNHYIYSTPRHQLIKKGVSLFLRKSIAGQLVIVMTDYLPITVSIKEKIGKFLSLFNISNKDIYFEKFSKGASESAYEVFKYSIENNDENSLFILDKDSPDFHEMVEKFGKKKVLAHNSIKSFMYIFKANRIISSDLPTHMFRSLYDNSKLLKKKILNNKKKIFLQHGISLATNVFERGYYNPKVPISPDYIVTNSKLETKLFKQYTNYNNEQLIETGTPNLDLYVNNNMQQNSISFILTWRPWDLTGNIEKDSYLDRYLQFINLIDKSPSLKGKNINIILHPKAKEILEEQFPDMFKIIEPHLYIGNIKNALLESKVVITDYSSVCFYAFAGGSNVVFFWGDKENAEKQYSSQNILQSYNVFGDVTYNMDDHIINLIENNYNKVQQKHYVSRFKEMVEFTQGDNVKNIYKIIKEI